MEDDALARVIAAEKEIHEYIETERARARTWLEGVREETEEELAREEEQIREVFRESVEKAREEAMARGGKIIRDAEERAGRLLNLGDETLKGIIMRRLNMILPE